jgi:hypothetical protein
MHCNVFLIPVVSLMVGRVLYWYCVIYGHVVPDEELDIDSIDGYKKQIVSLFPKPEGPRLECFCGDTCKMEVSGDYKTLGQRYWMCDNLAYDPKLGQQEVV